MQGFLMSLASKALLYVLESYLDAKLMASWLDMGLEKVEEMIGDFVKGTETKVDDAAAAPALALIGVLRTALATIK